MECHGVDVFVICKGRPEKLPRSVGALELRSVSNRGTEFSLDLEPDFMLVDWHRCRYLAKGKVEDSDLHNLLGKISSVYSWEKVQKLFVNEKGENLYSKS